MTRLKALWTEIVYVNVAWYDMYVEVLAADLELIGEHKDKAFERARTEGRRKLISYSETKLPQNYTQLFHMAGVFRGYRHLAKHIADIEGRLAFMGVFPRNCEEGLDNALHYHTDAVDVEVEDDATSVA